MAARLKAVPLPGPAEYVYSMKKPPAAL